jgi:acyl-CoA synthetase (AMP-forming)/AMP-acid ligase II
MTADSTTGGEWPRAPTVADLLLAPAIGSPDRAALVLPSLRLTYRDLMVRAEGVARGLVALGVGRGDRVGILMPNCAASVDAFFGTSLLGAVAVPINARFKASELAYVIGHADLRVLFTTDLVAEHVDFVALLADALPGLSGAPSPRFLRLASVPHLRSVVLLGESHPAGLLDAGTFGAMGADVPAETVARARSQVRVRDAALSMYTSGTTSRPKGCVLSHEAVTRNAVAVARRFELGPADRFWDPLPLFHMGALLPLLATLVTGGTFLTTAHFDPAEALVTIVEEGATVLYPTFPTITQELVHQPGFAEADLGAVRLVVNVAPPDQLRAMQSAFPRAVQVSSYGCTEVSGVAAYNELTDGLEERVTTCGRPFPGVEVHIVDPETGEVVGTGRTGEILVRGYSLLDGYYKDPEGTAAAIDDEGWFHTGDRGSLDAAGRIVFVGRLKDMLKVGGENVAAAEIESFLCTHRAVKIVQVVGMPDDRLVEVVQALVLVVVGLALGWRPEGSGAGSSGALIGVAVAAMVLGTIAFSGIGLVLAGTLQPLVNLAVVNTLFVILLLLGGMLIPLAELPGWLAVLARALPAAALADALHAALGSGVAVSGRDWLVLVVWAVASPVVAGLSFRWE